DIEAIDCDVRRFFFQAEDGIRDFHVTGVQTCALPISRRCGRLGPSWASRTATSTRAELAARLIGSGGRRTPVPRAGRLFAFWPPLLAAGACCGYSCVTGVVASAVTIGTPCGRLSGGRMTRAW